MRSIRYVAAILLLVALGAQAATRVYFVEPKELHQGKVAGDEQHGIRQSFVANVDSIYYIEWFCAEPSAEGEYVFALQEKESGLPMCEGRAEVPSIGWQWVKCSTFTGNLRFTKGKEYLLKVSHSGGDSVNFVYRTDNPYTYGAIEVGGGWGQPEPV